MNSSPTTFGYILIVHDYSILQSSCYCRNMSLKLLLLFVASAVMTTVVLAKPKLLDFKYGSGGLSDLIENYLARRSEPEKPPSLLDVEMAALDLVKTVMKYSHAHMCDSQEKKAAS